MRIMHVMCLLAGAATLCAAAEPARPATFEYTLENDAPLTSAGIYAPDGRHVRTLWEMEPRTAGTHKARWDGRDELGRPAPDAECEYRVVVNRSTYRNVGTIGNTQRVPTMPHSTISMDIDKGGFIYTANWWEEAGQGFRKVDKDGNHVMNAGFGVRNGKPNGLPYAIAVDGEYMYISVSTIDFPGGRERAAWRGHAVKRYHGTTGKHVPFEKGDEHGNIRVYPPVLEEEGKAQYALKALDVLGDTMLVADYAGKRVLKFDKNTGEPEDEIKLDFKPTALAVGPRRRVWLGNESGVVAAYDLAGEKLAESKMADGEVASLAFGPYGSLCVSDAGACVVRIYGLKMETDANPELTTRLKEALERSVSFDFVETPLGDVVIFLQQISGVSIILDNLQELGKREITLKVTDMELGKAIDWIVKQAGLAHRFRNRAIFISTEDKLDSAPFDILPFDLLFLGNDVEVMLGNRVSFDFVETPLRDVVTFMETITATTFVLDHALQQRPNLQVTLKVTDMPLEQALDWTMDLLGLDYTAIDGAIFISTNEKIDVLKAKLPDTRSAHQRIIGGKATLGSFVPAAFHKLKCAAIDPEGNVVVAHETPTSGVIVAKFDKQGECLWYHAGLEFCSICNYSQHKPDELISTRLHRYRLTDRDAGAWEYEGSMLDADPEMMGWWWNHGVPRLLRLGGNDFFFQCYGDGVFVFRRFEDVLRPVAIAAGTCPRFDGKYDDLLPEEEKLLPRSGMQWSWTDTDLDGVRDMREINLYKAGRGAGVKFVHFGMNIDTEGNVIYCEHHTGAIWELPLKELDNNGNPIYDWADAREVIPKDTSPVEFQPLMAVRAGDGTIYAFGRSGFTQQSIYWKSPENKGAWMGGWVLRRFAPDATVLFTVKLPEVCVGMDVIPGPNGEVAGLMLGWYEKAVIYHYTPDGLRIGEMAPGEPADHRTGWMDNTAALAVNRDPRDGIVDVFGEESLDNRILWYRVNDRSISTLMGRVARQ